jgi:hypothetical protein
MAEELLTDETTALRRDTPEEVARAATVLMTAAVNRLALEGARAGVPWQMYGVEFSVEGSADGSGLRLRTRLAPATEMWAWDDETGRAELIAPPA